MNFDIMKLCCITIFFNIQISNKLIFTLNIDIEYLHTHIHARARAQREKYFDYINRTYMIECILMRLSTIES